LEFSETREDVGERNDSILEAKQALERSIEIKPYNPDYRLAIANLYSKWAFEATELSAHSSRSLIAEQYYSQVSHLTPSNARYLNEWALHRLINSYDFNQVLDLIEQAQEIDPTYDLTYFVQGEYFRRLAGTTQDPIERFQHYDKARENYLNALEYTRENEENSQYRYLIALAGIYTHLEDLKSAINTYQQATNVLPLAVDRWQIEEIIAKLYYLSGGFDIAISHAGLALELAPDNEKAEIQLLIDLILELPGN
jgi:tetratricopeptide (TPR) repeat protein